jgi:hypothetical protein
LGEFPPIWGLDNFSNRVLRSGGSIKTTTEILRVAQNDGLGG